MQTPKADSLALLPYAITFPDLSFNVPWLKWAFPLAQLLLLLPFGQTFPVPIPSVAAGKPVLTFQSVPNFYFALSSSQTCWPWSTILAILRFYAEIYKPVSWSIAVSSYNVNLNTQKHPPFAYTSSDSAEKKFLAQLPWILITLRDRR